MNDYDGNLIFETGMCPKCGAYDCGVEKTLRPLRKVVCRQCHAEWQTITINLWEEDAIEKAAAIQREIKSVGKRKKELEEFEAKYSFLPDR